MLERPNQSAPPDWEEEELPAYVLYGSSITVKYHAVATNHAYLKPVASGVGPPKGPNRPAEFVVERVVELQHGIQTFGDLCDAALYTMGYLSSADMVGSEVKISEQTGPVRRFKMCDVQDVV